MLGCHDRAVADRVADLLATQAYRVQTTDDINGVEASAAMKNVYAIALGVTDGLEGLGGEPWNNLRAATFAQAVAELQSVAVTMAGPGRDGDRPSRVGDLEVTGLSGRNKVYGARIGKGESAREALNAMVAADQTVEGVAAARIARELVSQRLLPASPFCKRSSIVLDGTDEPAVRIAEAVLPSNR